MIFFINHILLTSSAALDTAFFNKFHFVNYKKVIAYGIILPRCTWKHIIWGAPGNIYNIIHFWSDRLYFKSGALSILPDFSYIFWIIFPHYFFFSFFSKHFFFFIIRAIYIYRAYIFIYIFFLNIVWGSPVGGVVLESEYVSWRQGRRRPPATM